MFYSDSSWNCYITESVQFKSVLVVDNKTVYRASRRTFFLLSGLRDREMAHWVQREQVLFFFFFSVNKRNHNTSLLLLPNIVWFIKAHAHQPDSQWQLIPSDAQREVCVYRGCWGEPPGAPWGLKDLWPQLLEVLPTVLPQLSASLGTRWGNGCLAQVHGNPRAPLLCSLGLSISVCPNPACP